MGQKRHAQNVLFGKPGGKSLLGRKSLSRDDSFKMDVKEIRWLVWTECIWLRIESSGLLLWTW
jgi:hypothetical protein